MTQANPDSVLKGRRILLTRPAQQQQSLQTAIEQQGGEVVSLPLLAIEAVEEPDVLRRARSLIQDLDQFQIIIFISSNAVSYGGDLIEDYWPQFPVGVQVIAIGETTARAASTRFACAVSRPSEGSDSESVLAMPQLSEVSENRIAIVRGQGGRELLASTLRERGARVDYIEVYRRTATPVEPPELQAKLLDPACDAVTVHSGESLLRLIELGTDNIDKVTLIPLVVPSGRIADQAREAGFQEIVNAAGADDTAMLAALEQLFAQAETGQQ